MVEFNSRAPSWARFALLATVLLAGLVAVPPGADAAEGQGTARRLSGEDRLGTAVAVSKEGFPQGSERAYLARSDSYPDALAAGALTDGPILLVPSTGQVPDIVLDEIARLDPVEVVALGGKSAVGGAVLDEAATGRDQRRLSGQTRVETAIEISEFGFPKGADRVFLTRADAFPDALAAGALVGGPVLLVPTEGKLPDVLHDEIARLDPTTVYALGGKQAVSNESLTALAGGRKTGRLSGAGRHETAVAISAFGYPEGSERVIISRSDAFPDALAAGALTSGPILLVPSCDTVPTAVLDEVSRLRAAEAIVLGGSSAVCQDVLDAIAAKLLPGPVFLHELTRVDSDGIRGFDGDGTLSVDGLYYPRSYWIDTFPGDVGTMVFDLGRDYDRFRSTVGIYDLANEGTAYRVNLRTEDAVLLDEVVGIGETIDVDADISNALRLTVELERVGGTSGGCCTSGNEILILGRARVLSGDARDTAPGTFDSGLEDMQYLGDRHLIELPGIRGYDHDVTIATNGLRYPRSTWADTFPGDVGTMVYDLGRDFERFRATVGIYDSAEEGTAYRVNIRAEGAVLFEDVVGIGETFDVDVDISNALRLTVEIEQVAGPSGGCCSSRNNLVVLGTARLLPPGATDIAPKPF